MSVTDRPVTGMPSGVRAATTLALWAAAWQAGASADRVLDALAGTGVRAGVRAGSAGAASRSGLPGPGQPSGGSVELLALLRRGGPPGLLLPAAGDLRGLPPGGEIVLPALDCGAVVALPEVGVGLLPVAGQWRALPCGAAHPTLSVTEVTRLLDDGVANATSALAASDLASARGNPRDAVRRVILDEAVLEPPGTPPAAAALLAKATTLAALLAVAAGHDTAAVTSRELAVVDDALSPLHTAVREARRTAVAAAVAVLLADRLAGRIR